MKKPHNLPKKTYILQYNKIKGINKGSIDRSEWDK